MSLDTYEYLSLSLWRIIVALFSLYFFFAHRLLSQESDESTSRDYTLYPRDARLSPRFREFYYIYIYIPHGIHLWCGCSREKSLWITHAVLQQERVEKFLTASVITRRRVIFASAFIILYSCRERARERERALNLYTYTYNSQWAYIWKPEL